MGSLRKRRPPPRRSLSDPCWQVTPRTCAREALTEFRALRASLQANGEWNYVTSFYQQRLQGRKRASESAQGSQAVSSLAMDEDGFEVLGSQPGGPVPTKTSSTRTSAKPTSRMTAAEAALNLEYPAGITSIREWGATVVEFGKFKADNLTYEHFVTT